MEQEEREKLGAALVYIENAMYNIPDVAAEISNTLGDKLAESYADLIKAKDKIKKLLEA